MRRHRSACRSVFNSGVPNGAVDASQEYVHDLMVDMQKVCALKDTCTLVVLEMRQRLQVTVSKYVG